jgi:hypothetical protein
MDNICNRDNYIHMQLPQTYRFYSMFLCVLIDCPCLERFVTDFSFTLLVEKLASICEPFEY